MTHFKLVMDRSVGHTMAVKHGREITFKYWDDFFRVIVIFFVVSYFSSKKLFIPCVIRLQLPIHICAICVIFSFFVTNIFEMTKLPFNLSSIRLQLSTTNTVPISPACPRSVRLTLTPSC
jgi:hypothetical protein